MKCNTRHICVLQQIVNITKSMAYFMPPTLFNTVVPINFSFQTFRETKKKKNMYTDRYLWGFKCWQPGKLWFKQPGINAA